MKFPFVSRDRYEAARAENLRLAARIASLEEKLDARAMGVLQAVLRKNGYAIVGEEIAPMNAQTEAAPPAWSNLDWRIFETWAKNYQAATGGTEKEAVEEYRRAYGPTPPSKALIV